EVGVVFDGGSGRDGAQLTGLRPLFDKTGAIPPSGPVPRPPCLGEPYFPAAAVDFYFYLFGNLVTVVGRDELLLATNGVVALRDNCLTPLLLAERGIRRAGG